MLNSILLNNYLDDFDILVPAVEAVIFASEEPVPLERLFEIFGVEDAQKQKKDTVLKSIEAIKKQFNERASSGIYLSVGSGGISFKTKSEFFDVISGSLMSKPAKFNPPQLETLSIIAYRQPVTKNEIDAIRGVDSASTVKFLLEKNLIKAAGRKDILGRPLLYRTTDYFLEVFNLKTLSDLPSVKEMDDVFKKTADSSGDVSEKNEPNLFE